MSRKWTKERVDVLVAAMGGSRTIKDGLDKASAALGMEVTLDAADRALRRAGYGTAYGYLAQSNEDIPVTWEPPADVGPHPADDDPPTMPGSRPSSIGWTYEEPVERILYVPDCHWPYADRLAWSLMIQCGRKFAPHRIVVLGDFVDCLTVSSHLKDPRRQTQLSYEIAIACEARAELDTLGATDKHFVKGNHEYRLYRYLAERAPALLDSVKIEELLKLRENGWTCTEYGQSMRLGDQWVTHAVNGVAGQNAHHRASLRYHRSVIIGHTHQIGYKVFGDALGNRYHATMVGWLGSEVEASYTHEVEKSSNWAHGFGLGYLLPSGRVHVTPVPIIDGAAVVHGEVIRINRGDG